MSKLVLIDGHAIMHRAFHALPKTLTSRSSEPLNAVYGFVSMLLKIITDLKPTHIAVCFDRKEPTFRHKAFEDYQSHRPETDKDLVSQFAKAKEVVETFKIPIYEKAGFEADDVIGTIANLAVKSKKSKVDKVVIVTGDRDLLQLVTSKIKVYLPVKGLSQAQLMGPDEVYEKLSVRPDQVDEYKALVGDPSDNYKGVPGIGPKTAEKLLSKYKDLDEIYSNLDKIDTKVVKKLKDGKKSAKMSQKLAQIVKDVPIKFDIKNTGEWNVGNQETIDLFKDYGFKTLTKRVIEFKGGINFREIILLIANKFKDHQYAIRGTASLVLQ